MQVKSKLTPNTIMNFCHFSLKLHFDEICVYCILLSYSSVEKNLSTRERKRNREWEGKRGSTVWSRAFRLQIVSSRSTGAWKHVLDMCASRVTAQSGRYREREREKSSLSSTNKLILISESQRAQESVCSGSPGVLDPLVSDLQIVLSHLIMVQAPWIFKEWLSDTCQKSLTRLMESTISEMVDWLGQLCGPSHKLDFFFFFFLAVKTLFGASCRVG